jgi:hypothetical protein
MLREIIFDDFDLIDGTEVSGLRNDISCGTGSKGRIKTSTMQVSITNLFRLKKV